MGNLLFFPVKQRGGWRWCTTVMLRQRAWDDTLVERLKKGLRPHYPDSIIAYRMMISHPCTLVLEGRFDRMAITHALGTVEYFMRQNKTEQPQRLYGNTQQKNSAASP